MNPIPPLPSLLLLEHVNYNIPSRKVAFEFYVKGLGCQYNPQGSNSRQLHVNCGVSQFHLPFLYSIEKGEPVTVAHVLDGHVELLTREPLADIRERLESLFPMEKGLAVSVEHVSVNKECADDYLAITGPWGNRFRVSRVHEEEADAILSQGGHAGGSDGMVAMKRVVVHCPLASIPQIASFYHQVLHCQATVTTDETKSTVVVPFGPSPVHQELVFEGVSLVEDENATAPNDYDALEEKRFHIALYLQDHATLLSTFHAAQDVLYINERFLGGPLEFSSSTTLEETDSCGQYRTKDMFLRNVGEAPFFTLEQEIRSPQHKSFPLKN